LDAEASHLDSSFLVRLAHLELKVLEQLVLAQPLELGIPHQLQKVQRPSAQQLSALQEPAEFRRPVQPLPLLLALQQLSLQPSLLPVPQGHQH
jgi:hypothetical protein